jgi:hypothetical protein
MVHTRIERLMKMSHLFVVSLVIYTAVRTRSIIVTPRLAGYEEIKRHSTFDHMSADTSQRQGTSLHTIIVNTREPYFLQFVGRQSDAATVLNKTFAGVLEYI